LSIENAHLTVICIASIVASAEMRMQIYFHFILTKTTSVKINHFIFIG